MIRAMPACPLCENVQPAGETCDVCGTPFPVAERMPVPVERLEGLEATALDSPEVPVETVPELEPTAGDPVEVVVAAMEGFMATVAEGIPDDGPTAAPAAGTCRYCRQASPEGETFCIHCGMRLPVARAAGAEPAPAGPGLCRDCGTPLRGLACPACGARASR